MFYRDLSAHLNFLEYLKRYYFNSVTLTFPSHVTLVASNDDDGISDLLKKNLPYVIMLSDHNNF